MERRPIYGDCTPHVLVPLIRVPMKIAPVHEPQEFGYLIISSRRIRAFHQRLFGKYHIASRQSPSES